MKRFVSIDEYRAFERVARTFTTKSGYMKFCREIWEAR